MKIAWFEYANEAYSAIYFHQASTFASLVPRPLQKLGVAWERGYTFARIFLSISCQEMLPALWKCPSFVRPWLLFGLCAVCCLLAVHQTISIPKTVEIVCVQWTPVYYWLWLRRFEKSCRASTIYCWVQTLSNHRKGWRYTQWSYLDTNQAETCMCMHVHVQPTLLLVDRCFVV